MILRSQPDKHLALQAEGASLVRWGEGSRLGFEVFGTSNLELQLRVPSVAPVSFESGIGGGSRSFILRAEYFIACYGDEGEENLPWPWRGGVA